MYANDSSIAFSPPTSDTDVWTRDTTDGTPIFRTTNLSAFVTFSYKGMYTQENTGYREELIEGTGGPFSLSLSTQFGMPRMNITIDKNTQTVLDTSMTRLQGNPGEDPTWGCYPQVPPGYDPSGVHTVTLQRGFVVPPEQTLNWALLSYECVISCLRAYNFSPMFS